MATYKSRFKGSQVDEAVTIANNNLNKGSINTPIFYNSNGSGQAIEKDTVPTVSSLKPLVSGGAYTGVNAVVDYSDIQTYDFNNFVPVGTPNIIDGILTTKAGNYVRYPLNFSNILNYRIEFEFTPLANSTSGEIVRAGGFYIYQNNTGQFAVYFLKDNATIDTLWTGSVSNTKMMYYIERNGENFSIGSKSASASSYTVKTRTVSNFVCAPVINLGTGTTGPTIDLRAFKVYINGQLAYKVLPDPTLPPSQRAVKQYVDAEAGLKQNKMYGGYGIDVDGTIVSVSDDVFREGEEEKLHADLKVDHFGDMSVGNDSEVLELMNEARHSSFDRSKFTVVGSPTITDDGIVITPTNTAYIYVPLTSGTLYNDYEINFNYVFNSTGYICQYANIGNTYQIYNAATASELIFIYGDENNSSHSVKVTIPNFNMSEGVEYNVNIHIVGTSITYTLTNLQSGTSKSAQGTLQNLFYVNSGFTKALVLYNVKSSDYKKAWIKVDGVEVFSGNKTGIDTIKPDDYTVVGTPTISADGVASGFSDSNYLITPDLNLENANSWEIQIPLDGFLSGSERIGNCLIGKFAYGEQKVIVGRANPNSSIYFYAIKNNVAIGNCNIGYHPDDGSGILKIGFNGSEYYLTKIINGQSTTAEFESTEKIDSMSGIYIGYKYQGNPIDLNALKIYVDGNLVYQPCLKIPYTLAKDGSKIVDSDYRDRIEDEYSRVGYTPYYSLQPVDKTNFIKVGSPTINNDFVASGFSSSNMIKTYQMDFSKPFEIIFSEVSQGRTAGCIGVNYLINLQGFGDGVSGNKGYFIRMKLNSDTPTGQTTMSVPYNTPVYAIKFGWTGTRYYMYSKGAIDGEWVERASYNSTVCPSTSSGNAKDTLRFGYNQNSAYASDGVYNLKELSVKIKDEPLYQAVIPSNYTMATVEENDIVDSYINGTTSYTKRANLQLEQQGICTANTAVTFPNSTSFIDANYALSIPYVSGTKTKTGFTPARDGDYIAEGYTSL